MINEKIRSGVAVVIEVRVDLNHEHVLEALDDAAADLVEEVHEEHLVEVGDVQLDSGALHGADDKVAVFGVPYKKEEALPIWFEEDCDHLCWVECEKRLIEKKVTTLEPVELSSEEVLVDFEEFGAVRVATQGLEDICVAVFWARLDLLQDWGRRHCY